MAKQGVLPFSYGCEPTASGMTALAGLLAYLELATAFGLTNSIRRHLQVCARQKQGWTDAQIIMPLVLLNVAGGDCVDDLRVLEADEGFVKVLRRVELHGYPRQECREQERRWRKERKRAVPSPSVVFRYLSAFDSMAEEAKQAAGRAFIPAPNQHLQALGRVNTDLLRFAQEKSPQREATLDQDASLVKTYKQEALYCCQGNKAYQPMTTYWSEQDLVAHSEFRDGNVPANYQNLRVLRETLDMLPEGVVKVYFRGDTAANQKELLRYCAEGKSERFGVIEFTIGVDVTGEFKRAVAEVEEGEWHPLERKVDGQRMKTEQEWAEVCFVPNWTVQRKEGPAYRYLAIRELLKQAELPGLEAQLPFPSMSFGQRQYKVFGLVTNRDIPGDKLIWWHRERCGKGEEIHKVMKEDLAGGHLPSGRFGANAAWWGIMVIAFNLNSIMKRVVLPQGWSPKRVKAIRFGFINLAGRVISRARQLIIRLSGGHPAYELLIEVRQRLRALCATTGSVSIAPGPL